jgi:hypothetical protein
MDPQTVADVQNSTCLSVSHYTVQILFLYKSNYHSIKYKHVYLHSTAIYHFNAVYSPIDSINTFTEYTSSVIKHGGVWS